MMGRGPTEGRRAAFLLDFWKVGEEEGNTEKDI